MGLGTTPESAIPRQSLPSAVADKLRGVSYAHPLKSWIRRALRLPTLYVLGDAHHEGGTVLKFLRRIVALLRSGLSMSESLDAGS